MPNCFSLTLKSSNKLTKLAEVDDMMREEFGEPPSADQWCFGWYDGIGLMMALGKDKAECMMLIREWYEGSPRLEALLRVNEWLWETFEVDSWSER